MSKEINQTQFHLRAQQNPQLFDEFIQTQKRLLKGYLVWPAVFIVLIGFVGYLLIPAAIKGPWLALMLLIIAGSVLEIPTAAALGGVAFISYAFWLLGLQLQAGISSGDLITLLMMPFAPLWFAILRAHRREVSRLDELSQIPKALSAINISERSLLPTAHAVERHIGMHLTLQNSGSETKSAMIFRLSIPTIHRHHEILGKDGVQQAIMRLVGELRHILHPDDVLAEDLHKHSALYILTSHRTKNFDESRMTFDLNQILQNSELRGIGLSMARTPQDGIDLHTLNWHLISVHRPVEWVDPNQEKQMKKA